MDLGPAYSIIVKVFQTSGTLIIKNERRLFTHLVLRVESVETPVNIYHWSHLSRAFNIHWLNFLFKKTTPDKHYWKMITHQKSSKDIHYKPQPNPKTNQPTRFDRGVFFLNHTSIWSYGGHDLGVNFIIGMRCMCGRKKIACSPTWRTILLGCFRK